MTRRMWIWVVGVAVLAAVDLLSTIHAHEVWKKSASAKGGPSVMTLGQLTGFISSTVLVAVVCLILASGFTRAARARQRRQHR
jgi:hypothetical protein